MFERILVPLDGSHLAEAALAPAAEVAKRFDAKLYLLQVLPLEGAPQLEGWKAEIPEEEAELERKQSELYECAANEYLTHVINKLAAAGIAAEAVVTMGDAADAILDCLKREEISLLVISSHGRGGLGRLIFGSIAEKVLHGTRVSVLVVHATPDGA